MGLTNNKKWIIGIIVALLGIIIPLIFLNGEGINITADEQSNINLGENNILGNKNTINNYYSNCTLNQEVCQDNTELLIIDFDSLEGNCPYVYVSNQGNSSFNEGTISLWVKLNDLNLNEDRYIFDFANLNNETFIKMWVSQNKVIKFSLIDSFSQEYLLSNKFGGNFSEWVFVVATWGNEEINLYVNGKKTQVIDIKSVKFKEEISGWYFGSSHLKRNCLNGGLDEIGLWNRPLSNEDVNKLYNEGKGCTYPFEDC
jgi:hypothetical protein